MNIITHITDNTEAAMSQLADWANFAKHMDPYTSNKTGEIKTQIESRLEYMLDRQCTFWWQQCYGNTAIPGEGGSEYAPFNSLERLETLEAEKRQQCIDSGMDDPANDMGYAGILIRLHETRTWFGYCRAQLEAYLAAYRDLNDCEFTYQPYEEKAVQMRQAASSTKTLLQMITNK